MALELRQESPMMDIDLSSVSAFISSSQKQAGLKPVWPTEKRNGIEKWGHKAKESNKDGNLMRKMDVNQLFFKFVFFFGDGDKFEMLSELKLLSNLFQSLVLS